MGRIWLLLVIAGTAWRQVRAAEADLPGKQEFVPLCGYCHGANAKGGAQGGTDLTQSNLVRGDENGVQLGAFLRVGRPQKGMPAFALTNEKVQAIATYLHALIRSEPPPQAQGADVLVGDAAAGRAFFEGSGACIKCHSVTGNLKGVGTKYPPATLQGRMILPIGNGGYPNPGERQRIPQQVTIRDEQGRIVSGDLEFLSEWAVTWVDPAGTRHTLPRRGEIPHIVVTDPLQAHLDLLPVITDKQMHDLTAYLANLR